MALLSMVSKVGAVFRCNFTVIATDLRGYGDSDKPLPLEDSSNYCKRVMALDQVLLMEKLGYQEFYLIGHDRGARVSHRLALDFPEKVKKLVLLDIAPSLVFLDSAFPFSRNPDRC